MIILGIDPGYAIIGYGVLEYKNNKFRVIDYGAITTDASMDMFDRFKLIYDEMNVIIEQYRPEFLAIEELFFNSNQKTAINVAQARGILLLSALNHNVRIFEYTPLQVKQAVAGYGRADKHQMQEMTKLLLGLQKIPRPDDAADALAIALTHSQTSKMNSTFAIK